MSHDEIIEQGEPDLEALTTTMRNSYIALGLRASRPSEYLKIYEDRSKTFDNWINKVKEQVWDEAYELGWDEADYYHKQAPGDPLKPATPNTFRT